MRTYFVSFVWRWFGIMLCLQRAITYFLFPRTCRILSIVLVYVDICSEYFIQVYV